VAIHPASVNHGASSFPAGWLIYNEKLRTGGTNILVRDSTAVTDYALLMFGGHLVPEKEGFSMLNGYLRFNATPRTASLVGQLRGELDRLLQRKIEDPTLNIHTEGAAIVAAVRELLHHDAREAVEEERERLMEYYQSVNASQSGRKGRGGTGPPRRNDYDFLSELDYPDTGFTEVRQAGGASPSYRPVMRSRGRSVVGSSGQRASSGLGRGNGSRRADVGQSSAGLGRRNGFRGAEAAQAGVRNKMSWREDSVDADWSSNGESGQVGVRKEMNRPEDDVDDWFINADIGAASEMNQLRRVGRLGKVKEGRRFEERLGAPRSSPRQVRRSPEEGRRAGRIFGNESYNGRNQGFTGEDSKYSDVDLNKGGGDKDPAKAFELAFEHAVSARRPGGRRFASETL
jgi:hypothetical protein